jgi:MFS family permease
VLLGVAHNQVMAIQARLLEPYRVLFAAPGVAPLTMAGFFAQLTQAAAPLGLLLVAQGATGSLAIGGGVVAAFSLGAGCGRPVQGALIDRRGPSAVLAVAGLVHGGSLVAAALLGAGDGPTWTLFAAAALGGVSLPAISASMRILFTRLATARRDTGFAAITVTQELGILLGPAIVGLLVATFSAPLALGAVAAAATAGTLWFARIPAARELTARSTRSEPPATDHALASGLVSVLAVAALFGGALGAGEVGVPAFAIEHGHRAASGFLIAAMSIGGVAGGLVVGAVRWSATATTRAAALLGLVAAGLAVLAAAPSILAIAILLIVAGCPINPAITNIALAVDDRTPAHSTAQAFGWMSTGVALGASVGSAVAGPLAQHAGSDAAFLAAGASAAIGAMIAMGTRTRAA